VRSCAVAVACAACSFSPSNAQQPIDASRGVDTRTSDAGSSTRSIDAPLDAFVAPAIKPIQSVVEPYVTGDDDFTLPISASKGDIVVAATYVSAVAAVTVTDTQQLTWTPLTAYAETDGKKSDTSACPEVQVQFWYAAIADAVTTNVTVHQAGAPALGMNLVEYAGVSTTSPIDGDVGAAAPDVTSTLSTPPLATSHFDAVVAVWADVAGAGVMTAANGWTPRGSDVGFYTLVVDNTPGSDAGTFTPTGALPNGVDEGCWVGAAMALRAR
jgi:hypothetical protein